MLLTIVFGFSASSRSFLIEFRGDVVPRLDGLRASILELDRGMSERLDRVIVLLDQRLPRPPA